MTLSRRHARGQNLVLMALTTLLLTLMVLGTLGISQRLRENHELQNVADAAAYSSAVQNARSFNNIAILNRTQVSLWVAQAADESLISWAAYARATINAAMIELTRAAGLGFAQYNPVTGTNPCGNVANDALNAYAMLVAERTAMRMQWQAPDTAAGLEVRAIQGKIAALRSESRSMGGGNCYAGPAGVCGILFDERQTQNISNLVLQTANLDGVTLKTQGASSSVRELDCGAVNVGATGGRPGLCVGGGWSENMLQAAMGSRGNPFVTARGVTPPRVQQVLNRITNLYPEFNWTDPLPTGSGYWSDQWGSTPTHASSLGTLAAWGDDHGQLGLTATTSTCSVVAPPEQIRSFVKSTQWTNTNDQHEWSPIAGTDRTPPEFYHTVGDCTPWCPSVWVSAVGFQPGNVTDAYGQPKVTVLLERDTSVIPRPWELNFKFHFARSGTPEQFDNRGQVLHGTFSGTDIHLAYAFATGVSYYHRKNHWVETPNLLNPYWRATLIHSDFDEQGKPSYSPNDVQAMLPNWRAQAYRELVNAGFKGFQ
jgi:hypothetical protein